MVELVWLVKLALQNKLIIIKKRRRWWIGKALPYEARKSAFLDYALGGECDVEFRAVSMSGMLEQNVVDGGVELDDDEITSEEEAIATAVRIFYNMVWEKDEQM